LLAKASNADFDTQWVNSPNAVNGIPTGGATGEILAKIDGTDYNAEWVENFTPQVKHEVKLGEAIAKGQAVYVSSANGTNMIVSKASNASEATSSKTMGLLETGGATNDFVKVVTEGLVAGVDTSTATAGDAVWLGTSGNLLFGLSNKPVAPAHMVYIGVVTRSNSSNGEIFVKAQNGFEINELHDVSISSPSAGQVIAYDSGTSLWSNQGGFVPTGAIMMWYTSTAPAGWILCQGQSTSGYTALAAVIGATVPDLRTRVPVGKGDPGTAFQSIGSTGGVTDVTLTAAQSGSPAHSHSNYLSDPGHSHGITDPTHRHNTLPGYLSFADAFAGGTLSGIRGAAGGTAINTGYSGTGVTVNGGGTGAWVTNVNNVASNAASSHTNLQPYIVMNYIIKT
jgi:microcystin-dependent protein